MKSQSPEPNQNVLDLSAELIESGSLEKSTDRTPAVAMRSVEDQRVGVSKGSFADLSRAYGSIAEWLGRIVDITNTLLDVRRDDLHTAINLALARTGELAKSDRTYIFRLRDPDRLDNTHEWVGPNITPVIEELQDLPISLLDEWRSRLDVGEAVQIEDTADLPPESAVREVLIMQGIKSLLVVPMMRDGKLTGFVGFDAVQSCRTFLPLEVQLLKSVSTAINVVMDRTAAETAAEDSQIKLQAERDRLQATLAAIPELVLELDADGRFLSYNIGSQLGPALKPEMFLGRLPEDFLPENLVTLLRGLLHSFTESEGPKELDYDMVVNGELRSFFLTAAQKSKFGPFGGYVLVIRDITARRQQRRALLRLSKIAELTSNLVIVSDAEGCIEWVNPAFERRTGWKLDEVRGQKPGRFLQAPDTSQVTLSRVAAALQRGEQVQAELLNRTRSGEEYWVSKDIQPIIGETGQVEGFVAVNTDITKLKQSHQNALRDRAMAMDASIDGIAMTDNTGRYTYMNRAHRDMFGILPNDDIRQYNWQDFCPPAAVTEFINTQWPQLVANKIWQGEIAGLKLNGEILYHEVSLTLKDDGGLLCIARDISQRLKADQERTKLLEELQHAQRKETIAHVTSGVAHDLNNIIAVVAGTTGLLEAQSVANLDILSGLARIRRATDMARDLVKGLSSLGRPETRRSSHDLGTLLSQAKDLLGSSRIEEFEIRLKLPNIRQSIFSDPTELLQLVVNLGLNACEAGPAGKNRVCIEALPPSGIIPSRLPDIGTFQNDTSYAFFTVSDTGSGVDPSVKMRMFERYFTTKGTAGTGLGLTIVGTILESNKAAMWFDTALHVGSVVTIAWPSSGPACDEGLSALPRVSSTSDLSGCTVLVVDDVPDVADVMAEILELAGAVAVSVSDPREAQLLLVENPDVWSALVTDFHMPVFNGAELARVARQQNPRIPSVLITALPQRATEHVALFDSILSKPVEPSDLISAVKNAVDGKLVTPRVS